MLNVTPGQCSYSAKFSLMSKICFFWPFYIIFANISTPSRSKSVQQKFLHCSRPLESAKKVAKRCNMRNKSNKKQILATWAKFIQVLHLAWCHLNFMNVPHYILIKSLVKLIQEIDIVPNQQDNLPEG